MFEKSECEVELELVEGGKKKVYWIAVPEF